MAVTIDGNNTPTAGGIGYGDGTELAFTSSGTSGQALLSAGAGVPTWGTPTASTATTATNLAGGFAGGVPYQSAPGTTAILAAGSSGQVLQSNGASAPSWVAASSGLSAATQAQMEAASVNTVAATPSNTQYHPGVAKAWINATVTGTINSSYNISSITDDGVGLCTIAIATDFSSANYVIAIGINSGSPKFIFNPNPSAGGFSSDCRNVSNANSDPDVWTFACYGDQA